MKDAETTPPGETPNPGSTGKTTVVNNQEVVITNTTTTVIGGWPVVHFIFLPTYVIWHSPWRWHYYPSYWHPWHPFYWHHYWGFHSSYNHWYYGHYRRWHYHRYNNWNNFYYNSRRSRSLVYYNRRQSGFYRKTYSKPETRRDGEALFKKQHPNNRLPPTKPGIDKPVTRPTKPVIKPERPVTTRPTKPAIQPERPITRPVTPTPQKPAVRPTKPVTTPAIQKPVKPVTKPAVKPSKDLRKGI